MIDEHLFVLPFQKLSFSGEAEGGGCVRFTRMYHFVVNVMTSLCPVVRYAGML